MDIGARNEIGGKFSNSISVYKASFGIVHLVLTMSDRAPAHELYGLKAGFSLDTISEDIPIIHLRKAMISHIGDNFPILQDYGTSTNVESLM